MQTSTSDVTPVSGAATRGARIVLTAPLTEIIDHAGYFIQMSMASLPMWLEGILNRKYPKWRDVEYNADGSARYMPAGVRVLEASLLRHYPADDIACCYPADLAQVHRARHAHRRRLDAQSARRDVRRRRLHVDLRIVEAADQLALRARAVRRRSRTNPYRKDFKVIVGGSGGWQITQTNSWDELSVDCVVEGRSESADVLALFDQALAGEDLPRQIDVAHPKDRNEILFPDKRTTFGVVEMTTGCGRRCQFCVPDLNPQIDMPKDKIMAAVRANVRDGNKQISLATEDMFIWGQVHTNTPFYFPNREALVDLYRSVVRHARRRTARAQPLDDRAGRRRSDHDRADHRGLHRQEPDPAAVPEHAPEAQGAGAAHRPRDRLGADGEADHAEQGRAVPDRRVAERRRPRARGAEQEQLVPGDDAHHRQPGRDRRGREGRRST